MRPDDAVRIAHRPRTLAERRAIQLSDLAIASSLALLAPLSWIMPEAAWPSVSRALASISCLADRPTYDKTCRHIGLALRDRPASETAKRLQSAVYELRMQNLRAWRPGGWHPPIVLEGERHLDEALARGKGVILWVAHFAYNSNITKIALHRRGNALHHLSRPEHGFSKTRFGIAVLNPIRCAAEDGYLARRVVFDRRSPAGAMRQLHRALKSGAIASITAGAWEGADLGEGPLLGGRLSVALGAPRLAAATGAALLPVFTLRDPVKGFLTAIEPPLAVDPSLPGEDMLRSVTLDYLRRHEVWIRRYPEQWRGWKEWQPARESSQREPAASPASDAA